MRWVLLLGNHIVFGAQIEAWMLNYRSGEAQSPIIIIQFARKFSLCAFSLPSKIFSSQVKNLYLLVIEWHQENKFLCICLVFFRYPSNRVHILLLSKYLSPFVLNFNRIDFNKFEAKLLIVIEICV